MQKHVNLVDPVKSFPMNIFLQNLASIQQRTSLIKFDHLTEKSEYDSISNLSTKAPTIAMRISESGLLMDRIAFLFNASSTAAEEMDTAPFEMSVSDRTNLPAVTAELSKRPRTFMLTLA